MRIPVALLTVLASPAWAQSWRPDMESGQDVWGLALVVSAAFAWITIRDAFRQSRAHGCWWVAGWAAITAAAVLVPPLRLVYYAVLLLFMLVVIVQMFRA